MNEQEKNLMDENPEDGKPSKSTDFGAEVSKGEFNDIDHLSEKEQKHPVAWKWVYSELSRLRKIEESHITLKDSYAELDKAFAVYKVSAKHNVIVDVVSSVLLALGPALLGLIPSVGINQDDSYMKIIFGILGTVFIVCAICIKIYATK